MRKKLIAGNWKMNKTVDEAIKTVKALADLDTDGVDAALLVPFTHLYALKDIMPEGVKLGAQNLHDQASGAFTGEISADMLLSVGCEYVAIGHSERRDIFGETDEFIARKLKTALEKDLKPILCIGEHLEEREAGKVEEVLSKQLEADFDGLSAEDAVKVVVAYEPIWAIGTGKVASDEDANETIRFIRSKMGSMYGEKTADAIRILYGGSVKPTNIKGLLASGEIDGALVGGASLEADSFARLVHLGEK